jgi:putative transposase
MSLPLRTWSTATSPSTAPIRLWVADISYLRTWEGFLYLAVVIDAFRRKVVGWAVADHLRTELVLDAFGMALFTLMTDLVSLR